MRSLHQDIEVIYDSYVNESEKHSPRICSIFNDKLANDDAIFIWYWNECCLGCASKSR
jgi:hypothetical protein